MLVGGSPGRARRGRHPAVVAPVGRRTPADAGRLAGYAYAASRRGAAADALALVGAGLLGRAAGHPRPVPPRGRRARAAAPRSACWSPSWPAASTLPDARARGRSPTLGVDRPRRRAAPAGTGSAPSAAVLGLRRLGAAVRFVPATGRRWAAGTTRPSRARHAEPTSHDLDLEGDGRGTRPDACLDCEPDRAPTRRTSPHRGARMSAHHGNTPAAWTAVVVGAARLRRRRRRADARPGEHDDLLGRRRPHRRLGVVFLVMDSMGLHEPCSRTDRRPAPRGDRRSRWRRGSAAPTLRRSPACAAGHARAARPRPARAGQLGLLSQRRARLLLPRLRRPARGQRPDQRRRRRRASPATCCSSWRCRSPCSRSGLWARRPVARHAADGPVARAQARVRAGRCSVVLVAFTVLRNLAVRGLARSLTRHRPTWPPDSAGARSVLVEVDAVAGREQDDLGRCQRDADDAEDEAGLGQPVAALHRSGDLALAPDGPG